MKKVLLFGICILLLLSACKNNQGGTPDQITFTDFKTGTAGLEIDFVENLPPEQIFEGAEFIIAAKVSNKGAYEARNTEVTLVGFEDIFYFYIDEPFHKLPSIEGRSRTSPDGEFFIEEFRGTNIGIPLATNTFPVKFLVQAAYDYETIVSSDFCVDTNIYTDLTINQKSCTPEKSLSLSGQGAPVAVTKIEQTVLPGKDSATLKYIVSIANKGNGKVLGKVRMKEMKLANKRLVCINRDVDLAKKNEENHIFVCSTTQQVDTNFLSKLSVSLVYRYQISQKKQFIIKRFTI